MTKIFMLHNQDLHDIHGESLAGEPVIGGANALLNNANVAFCFGDMTSGRGLWTVISKSSFTGSKRLAN